MPPLRNLPALILGLYTVALGHCGIASAQPPWEMRLRTEYPDAELYWHKLLSNISCDVNEISDRRELEYQLFNSGDAMGYVRSEITPAGVQKRVAVWTPESAFRLESNPKDEGYRVAGATKAADAGAEFARTRGPMIFESDSRLKSMIQVIDTSVSDFLRLGVPISVIEIDHDGKRLPQFQFDCSGLDGNFNQVTIVVDPEIHWGLRTWSVDFKATHEGVARTAAEITYDSVPPEMVLFPKMIKDNASLITESDTKELRVRATSLSNVQFGTVQDSAFQLESYGVPNVLKPPTGIGFPFNSLVFWSALVIGILTLGVLWKTRNREQRQ